MRRQFARKCVRGSRLSVASFGVIFTTVAPVVAMLYKDTAPVDYSCATQYEADLLNKQELEDLISDVRHTCGRNPTNSEMNHAYLWYYDPKSKLKDPVNMLFFKN